MIIDGQLSFTQGTGSVRRLEVRNTMNGTVEEVWDAITNSEKIAKWWTRGTIDLRVGGRIVLDDGKEVNGTILACFAPYIFAFTWHDSPEKSSRPELLDAKTKSTVRIDLIEVKDNKCQLTLIQYLPPNEIVGAAAGWHELIGDRLGSYLREGQVAELPDRFDELKAHYKILGVS